MDWLSHTCSNGHVRATEVVVDGSDHADDVEVTVGEMLLLRDQTLMQELLKKVWNDTIPLNQ